MYDLYVPIVEEKNDEISYQQASDIVINALAPLGENYVTILKKAFTQRWIDVYETPGKRSGAYSGGAYGTHPFILLNFQDKRESMYTLAHELGHAYHSYVLRDQPLFLQDYPMNLAETASTFAEAVLTEETSDPLRGTRRIRLHGRLNPGSWLVLHLFEF